MARKNSALPRLLQVVSLMHFQGAGRLRYADIAAACGCCERQVSRDLNALEAAGIPVIRDRARGCSLDPHYMPFKPQFSLQEALALLLCRESAAAGGEMPFTASAETAFDKIARLLPDNLRDLISAPSVQHVGGSRRDYGQAPWGCLTDACAKSKTVEIEYYSLASNKQSKRRIDPYRIVWLSGYCQLISYCHLRHDIRQFSVDGILRASATGECFQPDPKFSLKSYLAGAAGPNLGPPVEIIVEFDSDTARYAKRRNWGFDHKLTEQAGGSARMTATVRGLTDIKRELLSWGRHVQVIEPANLRCAIFEEAQAMAALHTDQ